MRFENDIKDAIEEGYPIITAYVIILISIIFLSQNNKSLYIKLDHRPLAILFIYLFSS